MATNYIATISYFFPTYSGVTCVGDPTVYANINWGTNTPIAQATLDTDFALIPVVKSVEYIAGAVTSDATPTALTIAGQGLLLIPINTSWTFVANVSARRIDATGSRASWQFVGLISQDATAATTVLDATTKIIFKRVGNLVAANDPVLSADTTNGALTITVTGIAAQTYAWIADITAVQVTN